MAIIASACVGSFPAPAFTVSNHDGRTITINSELMHPAWCLSTHWQITPDQARALAAALLEVAGPATLAGAA